VCIPVTATITPSPSESESPSTSGTESPSLTTSGTPTETTSNSATESSSPTSSGTPTDSPSVTETSSLTATESPTTSVTPTETTSTSASPSVAATVSVSPSVSPSVKASNSISPSRTSTPTETGTATASTPPAYLAALANATNAPTFSALIAFSTPGYSGAYVNSSSALAGKTMEGTNVTVGAYVRALVTSSMQVPTSRATLTEIYVRDDAGNVYNRVDVSRDPAFNPNASAADYAGGVGYYSRRRRAALARGSRAGAAAAAAADARALEFNPPARVTNSRLVFNVVLILTIADVIRTGGYEQLPAGQTLPLETQIYNRINAAAPNSPVFAALAKQWDAFAAVYPMPASFRNSTYIDRTVLVAKPAELVGSPPVGSIAATPYPYWSIIAITISLAVVAAVVGVFFAFRRRRRAAEEAIAAGAAEAAAESTPTGPSGLQLREIALKE
jgi:hypothetical protein